MIGGAVVTIGAVGVGAGAGAAVIVGVVGADGAATVVAEFVVFVGTIGSAA